MDTIIQDNDAEVNTLLKDGEATQHRLNTLLNELKLLLKHEELHQHPDLQDFLEQKMAELYTLLGSGLSSSKDVPVSPRKTRMRI